jgi:hypothetical protein
MLFAVQSHRTGGTARPLTRLPQMGGDGFTGGCHSQRSEANFVIRRRRPAAHGRHLASRRSEASGRGQCPAPHSTPRARDACLTFDGNADMCCVYARAARPVRNRRITRDNAQNPV